ncbi:OmpA family protein [Nesterenkonia alba]|uniref:OmpA family protein n=1 Tax=Nesterenkonia alba TaxID=515814 RepID=UPI0003B393C8|nr:OmpA family protein [Nesterenkonia alba]
MRSTDPTPREALMSLPQKTLVRRGGPAAAPLTGFCLLALLTSSCAILDFPQGGGSTEETPPVEETPEETDSPDETPEAGEDATQAPGSDEVLTAEVDEPITLQECEEAEEDDDVARVTWLDDVTMEEQEYSGTEDEVIEINGQQIELPGAPAVIIPERVGQAGCIIEYQAPGACLPRVEISRGYLPGVTLPERSIPQVDLPDGTILEEVAQEEIVIDAIEVDGVVAEEVCQEEDDDLEEGDVVWGVTRWSETRWSETQWSETQWSETRWSERLDDVTAPTMSLQSISASSLSLPTVTIPTERLETYRLDGSDHTERTDDDDAVSYITEGDVLFDSDEYELRSDAESELEAIAEDIAARDDDFVIVVEGHTDNLPTEVYDDNDELSELRAESVVEWLVTNADVDVDVITAIGRGEDYPRADNDTEEGRAENRRVVITVYPEDAEDEIDYDLEDE